MDRCVTWRRCRPGLIALALGVGVGIVALAGTARAQATGAGATAPATQPAAAPAAPTNDPLGLTGGATSPLTSPSYYLGGLPNGTTDKDGNFKATAADKPTAEEAWNLALNTTYHLNFVWALVAGFLVMFMQAGFALVETGLCRGKNAAHTMSMNFMVYALGMFGFFVCGFAFMCGGANGTNIGGPGQLGGVLTLDSMIAIGSAVTY